MDVPNFYRNEYTKPPISRGGFRSSICYLAMLSLLGRKARRMPGVRTWVCPSIHSALAGIQESCQSRSFGTSDLCIYGGDEPSSRREVHHWVEGGEGAKGMAMVRYVPTLCAILEASRWASRVGKWGGPAFSLKVAETLEGASTAVGMCVLHIIGDRAVDAGVLLHSSWMAPLRHLVKCCIKRRFVCGAETAIYVHFSWSTYRGNKGNKGTLFTHPVQLYRY